MIREIRKLDSSSPRAAALHLLEKCILVGADDLAQLAASKVADIPVSGSIQTSAMLAFKEHGQKLKNARASDDTFEALGLASTMTPHRSDLRLTPITRELMIEAGKHAQMPIPRIIHQVWIGPKPVPFGPPERWKKWCAKYGYEYRLWREPEVKELPCYGSVAYNSFLKRKRYAGVADVIRADVLHEIGGLYVDMDMFPIDIGVCLHEVLSMSGVVCLPASSYRKLGMGGIFFTNSILGSTKGNPIIRRYKNAMSPTVAGFDGNTSAWWAVGACLLTSSLASSVNTISTLHRIGDKSRLSDIESVYVEIDRLESSGSTALFFSANFW